MTIKQFINNVLERVLKIYTIFVIYSSVLAGILFPMLFIGGFFLFLKNFYRFSWYLADPTIFGQDLRTCWLNSHLQIPFFSSDIWLFLKVMIFIAGLILFVISLVWLVIGIRKNSELVQNKIYKHMRHPQNLSIIIMAFPLFLYLGFRMGDFVSWVQFIFIMIIFSDIGDIKLKKKYPKEFQLYYEKSGFFLPRLIPYRIGRYFSAVYNKKFRYPLLLLIYILSIFTLYQIFLVLPFFPLYI
ncbi:MAG: hypothetical protein E3J90_09270 [Promethearchaeota archaeon]|nr:MAG: hypothetical protein E3J90_09270 [Candidatus Lokiarchaeota archaeon]